MADKHTEKRCSGFTLAELLIVVAIIAILVAVSVPIFRNRTKHAREVVCENNRKTLLHQIWYERMSDDTFSEAEAKALIAASDAYCPAWNSDDESYKIEKFNDYLVSIKCDKHGSSSSGADKNSDTQNFLDSFEDFIANYKGMLNNDQIRKEFLEKYQKNWPTITTGGKAYSIQPLYRNNSTAEKLSDRIWLFAREASGSQSGWMANCVYNAVDGKWYGVTNWNGGPGSISILGYNDIYALDEDIRTKMENGHRKFVELTDYAISTGS